MQGQKKIQHLSSSGRRLSFILMMFLSSKLCHSYQFARPSRRSLRMAADSRKLRFFSPAVREDEVLSASSRIGGRRFVTTSRTSANKNGQETLADGERNQSSLAPVETGTYKIDLTEDESRLFRLLRKVVNDTQLSSTLRVAGGWVRDKLLATSEFQKFHRQDESPSGRRLTSKFHHKLQPQASMGRQGTKLVMNQHQPVDIDIALDDMLGREFADHLNEFLSKRGRETVPVGVVLKNPEKSKHLETATMKVGSFWIDFVNLRAEEYTQDSRIPDLMRIGTASEDAFRRDLTINALFYNINLGTVEDFTGRGFDDLRRGIVSTPLAPLTTLLDDPLRVLRAVRFAARLRFTIDDSLKKAAMDSKVRDALAQKVSRERVGGEVDLMLRSPDPVGAMRLLINLNLIETVFPIHTVLPKEFPGGVFIFTNGLNLLSTTFDYLLENKANPPIWCKSREPLTTHGFVETTLLEDEEARRLLWYAAFLKPLMDYSSLLDETRQNPNRGRKQNRSVICKLLVDHLKRPSRDAESIEKIMKAADDFSQLIESGCDLSAQSVLLSGIRIHNDPDSVTDSPRLSCKMGNMVVDSEDESDPLWQHAMEFRLLTSQVLHRVGPLWRAALVLSLIEQLVSLKETDLDYTIEGDVFEESQEEQRQGIIYQYDTFAASLQRLGLIGIWDRKPVIDGIEMKCILKNIPRGPAFREVMEEQEAWMTTHPGGGKEALAAHLKQVFVDYV